ncbi:MAG: DNA topoisomerase 3 [Puniceicoccales bacterium]|jgi:DNA topoisomerase-3|nr:DNA topoisomerase 3 [Puniceicoccales bacterium]
MDCKEQIRLLCAETMKKLVIAEKPSVAQDIADVIGKFKKIENIFENDEFVIGSTVGHIVELFMPEDFNEKLKRWSIDLLPIIPEEFRTKPITRNGSKFQELKKLMGRKDVGTIINACDAGREGELIFTYIYELAGCKKEVQRLWLSSMTREAIREGFRNLRPSSEMQNLQSAARCRSEADWLIGINGTRAITAKMTRSGGVVTIGRVQTPTLSMLLKRELEIRHFKPRPYARIVAEFSIVNGHYNGTYQRPDFKKMDDTDRADRIFDQGLADQIIDAIKNINDATVTEKKRKSKQNAPRLYDLTALQREANTRYGMPAGMTLKIAQSLYEKHKCITYPRTDSNALPEDYPDVCKSVMGVLGGGFTKFAQEILDQDWINGANKKIFNNKQISDHFAIIPTTNFANELSTEESKIYEMIICRFLAIFYPAAEFDVTTRISQVGEYEFLTEGKVLTKPGWLAVYGRSLETGENVTLPALDPAKDGDPAKAAIIQIEKIEEITKPPPRYNEATLLSVMETAGKMLDDEELALAMKERGLGTPATRAQIIEHLIDLHYMERNKQELVPTSKAEGLFEYLDTVDVQELSSPTMTGEWEYKLRQMEHGQLDRPAFMEGIRNLTCEIVNKIKNFNEADQRGKPSRLISPTDGLPMWEYLKTYKSQDGKITLNKVISGRRMLEEELEVLLRDRWVGPIEGFRSKIGKVYTAKLILDDNNEIKFSFPSNREFESEEELTLEKLKIYPNLCKCCCCSGNVYATESAYICENFVNEKKCSLRLGRRILEQRIDEIQAKKLLEEGKSDLLENFCSKRTGRIFAAFLTLNTEGKIGFEFAPRERKQR